MAEPVQGRGPVVVSRRLALAAQDPELARDLAWRRRALLAAGTAEAWEDLPRDVRLPADAALERRAARAG